MSQLVIVGWVCGAMLAAGWGYWPWWAVAVVAGLAIFMQDMHAVHIDLGRIASALETLARQREESER